MISPTDLPVLLATSGYADVRDLAKALLGLNTAVLVFSLTFADRMVGTLGGQPAKVALVGAWSAFLTAIAIVGVALWGLAPFMGRSVGDADIGGPIRRACDLLLGAGLLSGLGLCGLFVAAVLALRLREAQRGAQSS